MSDRPETGPMKFGDDWTGVFIRGDDAFHFARQLETVLGAAASVPQSAFSCEVVKGLLSYLDGSREAGPTPIDRQRMKAYDECVATPLEGS
ncbi:MAG: hypothetical protein ACHREM_02350 [Polyangiales bacterium]